MTDTLRGRIKTLLQETGLPNAEIAGVLWGLLAEYVSGVPFLRNVCTLFNDGDRITRRIWNNRRIYCVLEQGRAMIVGGLSAETGKPETDGKFHPWTITEEDFFAEDWEIVE